MAVAAAKKEKAEAVLAATEHLAQLQAQPIDAFEPLQTGRGWFDGIGAWLDGVGEWLASVWDSATDWLSEAAGAIGEFAQGDW